MNFFKNLFSSESSEERFVKKHVKRVLNKYSQKEIREESLHALAERNTPESLYGLLQRFTYNHPEGIIDENEKNKVLRLLELIGPEDVGAPLRRFLKEQHTVSMALLALERLEGEKATKNTLQEQLQRADPGDKWSAQKRLQLVNHLDQYEALEDYEILFPFLEDVNDDVIFRCIDLLEKTVMHPDQTEARDAIRAKLVALLLEEETSMRIRARILDLVRSSKWYIGDHKDALKDKLPEGYFLDKRGHLKISERFS
ncbi:MAG: hypothetical protein AAGJ35_08870 [Myxococcota bacterium]